MVANKDTEVIVIGAGPSGLTTAKLLASSGIETIVLERVTSPGIKNFYSGIASGDLLEDIFGRFWNGIAPVERHLSEYRVYLLQEDSFTSTNTRSKSENNYIVLRKSFNNWMLSEVKNSGVQVLLETLVTDLIVKDKKVCGVKTSKREYFSDVVIIAEGTNSVLTKQAGLRTGELTPEQVFLFVEENILLSSEIIEERFNVAGGEGIVARFFTQSIFNMQSIGYLSTNKDSVSLGVGVHLSELISHGVNINHCQEKLKNHPAVRPLIAGGTTDGYFSYILPSSIGGYHGMPLPRIYTSGCLLIGGAGLMVDLFSWDLSTLAVISSKLAAETIIKSKELNDYSKNSLSFYEELIKEQISAQHDTEQNVHFTPDVLNGAIAKEK